MSFTKPLVGSGRWAAPSIKATLHPGVGLGDMANVASGKKRDGRDIFAPKMPGVPDAPPPPVIEDTQGAQQDEADRLRRRRGRAASFLSGNSLGQPATASKVLLGS